MAPPKKTKKTTVKKSPRGRTQVGTKKTAKGRKALRKMKISQDFQRATQKLRDDRKAKGTPKKRK